MKTVRKIFRITGIVILSVIAAFFVTRSVGMGMNKLVPEGGINESGYVEINGTRMWINIYGQNKDNPVLLYLHGGPGSATSAVDYAFTRKWSDIYTVVTWDQRGCGKSFDKEHKDEKITAEMMMQDGREMTEYLLDHMGKTKITLLGHSWGSMYGANLALEYPEYYEAFIGTGMFIDDKENERRFYDAAAEWTKGDPEGQKLLEKLDMSNGFTMEYAEARNSIMERYGYDMMKDGTDYNMVSTLLFNPNYMIKDYVGYVANSGAVPEQYTDMMDDELDKLSLIGRTDYKVPFYNINGDMDHQTDYELACEYFEQVNAPDKEMLVMKNATHGLLESRSEEFSDLLHQLNKKRI